MLRTWHREQRRWCLHAWQEKIASLLVSTRTVGSPVRLCTQLSGSVNVRVSIPQNPFDKASAAGVGIAGL